MRPLLWHLSHLRNLSFIRTRPLAACFCQHPVSRSSLQYLARNISTTTFEVLDPSIPVEEETIPFYDAEHYYPVKLGETFQERYKTVSKLGFGTASTVWLCSDLTQSERFVALKVYINRCMYHRETWIYQKINESQSEHTGSLFIRKMYEMFEIEGPHGDHICLVHEPLGISVKELRNRCTNRCLPAVLARGVLRSLLIGLDFLHNEVQIIHTGKDSAMPLGLDAYDMTDLQPSNMLLGVNNQSLFAQFEQDEITNPTPRKELVERTIYLSRHWPLVDGHPHISDLSEARFGHHEHNDLIMPTAFRAPEVLLGLTWSYPVDIWATAILVRFFNVLQVKPGGMAGTIADIP